MLYFYYRTLDKGLKKAIENRSLNEVELKSIWHNIKEDNIKKRKVLNLTMLITAGFALLSVIITCVIGKDIKVAFWTGLICLAGVGLIYLYLNWSLFSLYKSQYNRCIRKYYPEYDGIYTL